MLLHLESNFSIPGLENVETLRVELGRVTLRQVLELIAGMSPTPIRYLRSGSTSLDPAWEVRVNGVAYERRRGRLDTRLKEGDTISIRITTMDGG